MHKEPPVVEQLPHLSVEEVDGRRYVEGHDKKNCFYYFGMQKRFGLGQ